MIRTVHFDVNGKMETARHAEIAGQLVHVPDSCEVCHKLPPAFSNLRFDGTRKAVCRGCLQLRDPLPEDDQELRARIRVFRQANNRERTEGW